MNTTKVTTSSTVTSFEYYHKHNQEDMKIWFYLIILAFLSECAESQVSSFYHSLILRWVPDDKLYFQVITNFSHCCEN